MLWINTKDKDNEAFEASLLDMSPDQLSIEHIRQLRLIQDQLDKTNVELTKIRNNAIFWFWLLIISTLISLTLPGYYVAHVHSTHTT